MADVLFLCFDAPLQAWGVRSRWDVRDSGDEPSKSGVIGLLGAALGYPVGDRRLAELDRSLRMGVRVERPGSKIVDFQTVSGVLRTAAGGWRGTPDNPETIVSPRTYIQDAVFLIALEGSREVLEMCKAALEKPRWPIFLGRKSCVPSRPVLVELTDRYSGLREALARYPWICRRRDDPVPAKLRCVIEDPEGGYVRPDRIQVNPARMYGHRAVTVTWVDFPGEVAACAIGDGLDVTASELDRE